MSSFQILMSQETMEFILDTWLTSTLEKVVMDWQFLSMIIQDGHSAFKKSEVSLTFYQGVG
jgi:peptidyl-tRNA hydrolase